MKDFVYIKAKGAENYVFSESHPLKPERVQWTEDLSFRLGVLSNDDIEEAYAVSTELVCKVHDPRYVECVKALSDGNRLPELLDHGFGSPDNPPFLGMFEASMAIVSGSVTAAKAIMDGVKIAINLYGGLHHAKRSMASGFCIFNDPAIAIVTLKEKFKRIMYIDIDAHHGDGVQWFFYEDPQVLTFSIHESGMYLYPGTGYPDEIGSGPGTGYCVNVPLERFTDDEIWWWAIESLLPTLFQWFKPEVIVLQMGADAHYSDPLTQLQLTVQGWHKAVELTRSFDVPVLALGGGGYSLIAVPRMWTWAIGTLKGITPPKSIPPDHFLYQQAPRLYDIDPPEAPEGWKQITRHYVKEVLNTIYKLLAPHGIFKNPISVS